MAGVGGPPSHQQLEMMDLQRQKRINFILIFCTVNDGGSAGRDGCSFRNSSGVSRRFRYRAEGAAEAPAFYGTLKWALKLSRVEEGERKEVGRSSVPRC